MVESMYIDEAIHQVSATGPKGHAQEVEALEKGHVQYSRGIWRGQEGFSNCEKHPSKALDLSTGWRFDIADGRAPVRQVIEETMPFFFVGSPACTAYSVRRHINDKTKRLPGSTATEDQLTVPHWFLLWHRPASAWGRALFCACAPCGSKFMGA